MRFRFSLFVIGLLSSLGVNGQSEEELLRQLQATKNDSLRFFIQRDLGYLFEFTDSAKAMGYYSMNLPLAQELNSKRLLSMVWLDFGRVQSNFKHRDSARKYYLKSLQVADESADYKRVGVALTNIGNTYLAEYRFDLAASYLFKAISAQEKALDSLNLALSYSTLGVLFEDAGKFDNALFYLKKCKEISLLNHNYQTYLSASITEAVIYMKKGDMQSMHFTINKALVILSKYIHLYYKASFYQNISGLYFDSNDFLKANQYADSSLYYHTLNDPESIDAATYMSKGLALIKLNQIDLGKTYLVKALNLAIEEEDWQVAREIYLELAEIAADRGDWKSAYENHTKYVECKDSTYTEELAKNASELSIKFQSEKQQLKIDKLAEENKINTLLTKQERRKGWFMLAGGSLLALIFILLFIIQRRKNQFIQKETELQLEQIKRLESEKKVVVLDSMLKGEENERSRVAKDLHDGVGSLLSGVKLSLSSMQGNMIIQEEHARVFEKSLLQLDDAISEMRRVAYNMMPAVLHHSGLIDATRGLVHSLAEASGVSIHFEYHFLDERLPNEYEIILYRLIQELLNNALKHSQASNIIVQLNAHENHLSLVVEDNGKGFDLSLWEKSTGMGFHNLKNRVEYLNGIIHVNSSSKEGTSFLIEFELNHAKEA